MTRGAGITSILRETCRFLCFENQQIHYPSPDGGGIGHSWATVKFQQKFLNNGEEIRCFRPLNLP